MSTVTVEHLHARYRTSPATAHRLGGEVHPLIGPAVASALLDASGIPDAAHVCVPSLELAVELDLHATARANGRAWADELVSSLLVRLGDGDVVVYRRHADALVDALVGLTTGDLTRAGAWRQAGVVATDAPLRGPDEVVPALVEAPSLLPSVLAGAVAARVVPRLDERSWRLLGHAWQRAGHRAAIDRRVVLAQVSQQVARLIASVPAAVLASPEGGAVTALLTTLLPITPPGGTDTLRALAAIHALRTADAAPASPPPADTTIPAPPDQPGDGPGRPDRTRPDADGPGRPAPADASADDEPPSTDEHAPGATETASVVHSDWAGLLLLLRPLAALGIAEELAGRSDEDSTGAAVARVGVAAVLAAVAGRLAPVAADDPALRVLRGEDPTSPAPEPVDPLEVLHRPLRAAADRLVTTLAARVDGAVRGALGLAADEDLASLWRCHGSIEWSPAWIEVTFPLDRVDVGARRAGIDLDPGWVWWLGAVVRFRHA